MSSYTDSVFLNCPFDGAYRNIRDSIIFAIQDCGFLTRTALELDDSSVNRFEKIASIIEDSRYGIHDVSRVEVDDTTGYPRFNMSLELGLFLGSKRYGGSRHRSKMCLVLDSDQYRYRDFMSDIAGQDVRSHENDGETAAKRVCSWLRSASRRQSVPGPVKVAHRLSRFMADLPEICSQMDVSPEELEFPDYLIAVNTWVDVNPL